MLDQARPGADQRPLSPTNGQAPSANDTFGNIARSTNALLHCGRFAVR